MAPFRQHGLADRLAGEQVVAEINRIEPPIPGTMRGQPAAGGAALAVLLVMPVLRHDEFRLQRHGAVVTGCDHGGGKHCVEILGLVLAALAVRAVRAVNLPGAMILGAVQCDQHVPAQAAHRVQAA